METTESNLRLHLRPTFRPKPLNVISHQLVQRWQNQLESKLGYSGVMACRSLLNRILQAAHDDSRIPSNPVRKILPPERSVDPEKRFGRAKRHTLTPEEFGRFLAGCLPFYWDHFISQVGTGLRPSELLGLRACRIRRDLGHLEVLEVRYEAGRFGSGYKPWPKSNASVRPTPISDLVGQAIDRRLASLADPQALAFPGPGGNRHARRGAGGGLSTGNYRRAYKAAVAEANQHNDPADWLKHLDLRGPHDLRRTFATWLEDAGIPSRVIDELMGHEGGRMERGVITMLHLRAGLAVEKRRDGTLHLPSFTRQGLRVLRPVYKKHSAWSEFTAILDNPVYELIKRFRDGMVHHRRWPSELHGESRVSYWDAGGLAVDGGGPERIYVGLRAQEHMALLAATWNEVIRPTVELGGRLLSPTSEGNGTSDADSGQ